MRSQSLQEFNPQNSYSSYEKEIAKLIDLYADHEFIFELNVNLESFRVLDVIAFVQDYDWVNSISNT